MRPATCIRPRAALAIAIAIAAAIGLAATQGGALPVPKGQANGPAYGVARRPTFAITGVLLLMPLASLLRRRSEFGHGDPFDHITPLDHRRDELGIIVDVLVLAATPVSKKAIRHGVRLNLGQTNRYISFLVGRGLLTVTEAGGKRFATTDKGRALVGLLNCPAGNQV